MRGRGNATLREASRQETVRKPPVKAREDWKGKRMDYDVKKIPTSHFWLNLSSHILEAR
jgi:hypothetical protein